jgi:hypothetical protein
LTRMRHERAYLPARDRRPKSDNFGRLNQASAWKAHQAA